MLSHACVHPNVHVHVYVHTHAHTCKSKCTQNCIRKHIHMREIGEHYEQQNEQAHRKSNYRSRKRTRITLAFKENQAHLCKLSCQVPFSRLPFLNDLAHLLLPLHVPLIKLKLLLQQPGKLLLVLPFTLLCLCTFILEPLVLLFLLLFYSFRLFFLSRKPLRKVALVLLLCKHEG